MIKRFCTLKYYTTIQLSHHDKQHIKVAIVSRSSDHFIRKKKMAPKTRTSDAVVSAKCLKASITDQLFF